MDMFLTNQSYCNESKRDYEGFRKEKFVDNLPKLFCKQKMIAQHHTIRLERIWMHPVRLDLNCRCIRLCRSMVHRSKPELFSLMWSVPDFYWQHCRISWEIPFVLGSSPGAIVPTRKVQLNQPVMIFMLESW